MLNFLSCTVVVLFHLLLKVFDVVFAKLSSPSPSASSSSPSLPPKARVAVIGGGIAGVSAAWSLAKSKHCSEVWLLEPRGTLGGNAKTHTWSVDPARAVTTGLSVLAWPAKYFRHYEMLLRKLGLRTKTVTPKFFVSVDGQAATFRQGADNPQWIADQDAWDSAVAFVRRANSFCVAASRLVEAAICTVFSAITFFLPRCATAEKKTASGTSYAPSLYTVVYWNPMNLIPARFLCQRIFGVSDPFWDQVVVAIYSSSFLTAKLNDIPSVILPALDDIISVGRADGLKQLHTWENNSKEVFDRMAAEIVAGPGNSNKVMVETNVLSCVYSRESSQWTVTICKKGSRDLFELSFDWVIFACPATAVDSLTNFEANRVSGFRSALFESLVPSVLYENQRDVNFVTGAIHAKREVLPAAFRDQLISEQYSNYIELFGDSKDPVLENTFILGTWVPSALRDAQLYLRPVAGGGAAGGAVPSTASRRTQQHRGVDNGTLVVAPSSASSALNPNQRSFHDMYVTYNCSSEARRKVIGMPLGEVDNTWAHPQLSMASMAISMAMPLLQGQSRASYCASYTTPGNGHDLSLLSGLVVARSLTGYYPFEDEAGVAERGDFDALAGIMSW